LSSKVLDVKDEFISGAEYAYLKRTSVEEKTPM
jgi:hypothetical protein